jgi:hypothetical protein
MIEWAIIYMNDIVTIHVKVPTAALDDEFHDQTPM